MRNPEQSKFKTVISNEVRNLCFMSMGNERVVMSVFLANLAAYFFEWA